MYNTHIPPFELCPDISSVTWGRNEEDLAGGAPLVALDPLRETKISYFSKPRTLCEVEEER